MAPRGAVSDDNSDEVDVIPSKFSRLRRHNSRQNIIKASWGESVMLRVAPQIPLNTFFYFSRGFGKSSSRRHPAFHTCHDEEGLGSKMLEVFNSLINGVLYAFGPRLRNEWRQLWLK